MTATAGGFYGPQGRVLRLALQDPDLNAKIDCFQHNGVRVANLEMETSANLWIVQITGSQCLFNECNNCQQSPWHF